MLDILGVLGINTSYLIESLNAPHIYAATSGTIGSATVSLDVAITNLTAAFSSLRSLLYATSFVIGMFLIVKGVMGYKVFATQTMASAQKGEISSHLITILIGAVLMYLPSSVDSSIGTLFAGKTLATVTPATDLIGYASISDNTNWAQLAPILIQYMDLIGIFAFVRGWLILSKAGHSGGGQPGQVGKGIIHIIAGVLLMNIVDTVNYLAITFGFSNS